MDIGFNEISSAIIGFLFGLLISWTTKLHQPPESQIVKDMLSMLKKGKKKSNSWPPVPKQERDAEMVRQMIDLLLKKERQLNGKKENDEENSH